MLIGIDASRAFIKNRTGIEEYSYRVIEHLRDKLDGHRVILYLRKNQSASWQSDFILPNNWKIKIINFPYFWTQVGLSLEMLFHPVDTLFVPAHTVPLIHPENTIVTIHGLEYEFCPEAYSLWGRFYMRCTIKKSCQWASSIIAVSENTKRDLMRLYNVDNKKTQVIYEGYACNDKFPMTNDKSISNIYTKYKILDTKYLLFIGRLEARKNIANIINAFEILKEQYKIPHKLILAGMPGFGYEKIKNKMANVNCCQDIIELGHIAEEEKWKLFKNASVFVFPTLYEGFGIPILEAQSAGCPVIASNNSSIPEVASDSALLINPNNAEEIADAIYKLISDENLRNEIIKKGQENVQRFSWEKCGKEISYVILSEA